MAGWIDIRVSIIKGGMATYKIHNPIFETGPLEPRFSKYLVFEGISVENDKQHYLNATLAYRNPCINAINYLKEFGYTGEQAYMILSTAPVEGRISGIVDIPNAICTVALPADIFEDDILPKKDGPTYNVR